MPLPFAARRVRVCQNTAAGRELLKRLDRDQQPFPSLTPRNFPNFTESRISHFETLTKFAA
jgi:hypothetical protein